MTKYDAVDRLMEQASEPVRDPEAVLEAKVSASEPLAPPGTVLQPKGSDPAEPLTALSTPSVQTSALSASERGRNLLGALRPFLPAVGGALRLVDHGAAQAAARLLPLLGSLGNTPVARPASASSQPAAPQTAALQQVEAEQARLSQELASHAATLAQHEENMRKLRDGLSRVAAEENAVENSVAKLKDRTGLLTAAVVILALLVIAELALLLLHRQG